MKAVILEAFGGVENLKMKEVATPKPEAGEVLVKIVYTAVNPVDWKIRLGMLENRIPHEFPIVPGWDAAGIVEDVGQGVKGFKKGDEVFAYCRKPVVKWGTYAEYITLKADAVAFKPKKLTFAQAAAFPLAGLTAWQSLFDAAELKKGQTVLIHAGAGGVGSLAIQFAKYAGATVYTTASEDKFDYVKKLGADFVIDYKNDNFVTKMKSLQTQGVDAVFDTVGGQTQNDSYQVIKKGGHLVSIVQPPDEAVAKNFGVKALYHFVSPSGKELQQISDLIEKGEIDPIKVEEMKLEEAGKAQEKNREGHMTGKIVLKI